MKGDFKFRSFCVCVCHIKLLNSSVNINTCQVILSGHTENFREEVVMGQNYVIILNFSFELTHGGKNMKEEKETKEEKRSE